MFARAGGMRRFGLVLAVTAMCVGGRPVGAACNGRAATDLLWCSVFLFEAAGFEVRAPLLGAGVKMRAPPLLGAGGGGSARVPPLFGAGEGGSARVRFAGGDRASTFATCRFLGGAPRQVSNSAWLVRLCWLSPSAASEHGAARRRVWRYARLRCAPPPLPANRSRAPRRVVGGGAGPSECFQFALSYKDNPPAGSKRCNCSTAAGTNLYAKAWIDRALPTRVIK